MLLDYMDLCRGARAPHAHAAATGATSCQAPVRKNKADNTDTDWRV